MFVLDGGVVWSASDLTTAAACEYAFLRRLDERLGRSERVEAPPDPLMEQISGLGLRHERRVLEELESRFGVHEAGRPGGVVRLASAGPFSRGSLEETGLATVAALEALPDVVFQAGFFDGEFSGYADFLRRTEAGWVVADSKLARRAKVSAMLQVAAYADQLLALGAPVAPEVELVLGTGATVSYPLAEILPVFRERRERLRSLIATHQAVGTPVDWYAPGLLVCGRCADCARAAEENDDLVLVANLRMTQREKLRAAGVRTVHDLAGASSRPADMGASTFEKLQAQARLQVQQLDASAAGEAALFHDVFDPLPIQTLPEPSPGDLFFDFEGDPMHQVEGSDRWGLEYLWGVQPARDEDGTPGEYWSLWADEPAQEREALIGFLDRVAEVRAEHPGMHIYHYAAYEVTALKRLVAEHKTHEDELDDLLRHGVFVDFYATVRSSLRTSQPSYSIKKLEPFYMAEGRQGEVVGGDASIAEYQCYRELVAEDDPAAAKHRQNLLDYNAYDCLSTLELRDWLRSLVPPLSAADAPPAGEDLAEEKPVVDDDELVALRGRLLERAGPPLAGDRTDEEQTWAMLESSLGYFKREAKPFWWGHFDRLMREPEEWGDSGDVLVVERAEVVTPWHRAGRQKSDRRVIRLSGRPGAGSTLGAGVKMFLLYARPGPAQLKVPEGGLRGWSGPCDVTVVEPGPDGGLSVEVTELLGKEVPHHELLPMALAPGPPPMVESIQTALRRLAEEADRADRLLPQAGVDVLCRRPPRTVGSIGLMHTGAPRRDIVATLLALDRSYLAVQGPPGTGKTHVGSQVIAELVRDHGWKVGVVAQSHAVVENMLSAIVGTGGLDPGLVGKIGDRSGGGWEVLKDNKAYPRFADDRSESGFVYGGTAWGLTNKVVEPGSLDLVVVDEAGQFSLAAMLAVSTSAQRLLLLGDPQQLSQVTQGTHGEPVDRSALDWVIGDRATMPRELGYFLPLSWRMHPSVCEPVSRLSYDGELHSAPAAAARSLEGVAPGLEVVALDHFGNSVCSPEEADEVVRRVRDLVGTPWRDGPATPARPLDQDDFVVVAPYNAQRQLISERLSGAGLGEVRVGTVDKFQGQEAPVVIVSMSASSAADVPRGMGFLLDRHRVNVAVSRAQWLAVLIRSRDLTSHVPGTPEDLLELGAFVGLCGSAP